MNRISKPHKIAGITATAAGTSHGFIYGNGAFSAVDVAGATSTLLSRIKNGGSVTGVYSDAVNGLHGLIGR